MARWEAAGGAAQTWGAAVFLSTFEKQIDKKGRVSVPATFRAALATSHTLGQNFSGIVALPAFRYDALQCAGLDWLQTLVDQMGKVGFFWDGLNFTIQN